MSTGELEADRINDFGAVRISLASPHDIRSWSFGEVKKPETINYRTYRPERDGLFCERIFGPEKDWECACGKYRGLKYKGMICDRCGVKVTHSSVRRKRMGHLELAAPVVHIWFFKVRPDVLPTLLRMRSADLEKVISFQGYVVIEPGDTNLKRQQLLSEEDYCRARKSFGDRFKADMGAEAIKKLLEGLNLVDLAQQLRQDLSAEQQKNKPSKQKLRDLVNRLKVVEALRDSGLDGAQNKPEWMVLDCIPVIPPDLRPLVLLDSGNFATSDLNDLYRRIINRNNRLKKLVDLNADKVIIRNEKRMLQQSVDALFDNNRCKRPVLGSSNRPLKSLTDMIKGKQGRFRESLLGKRVDYSATAVVIPNPRLLPDQCGLPRTIALELLQPFIIHRLKELGYADTTKSAKKMLEHKDGVVWDILEQIAPGHPILIQRFPSLHRANVQAFQPVLVNDLAIHLPPLVCRAFNADFNGDQVKVHLPLSVEAQVEAAMLLSPGENLFDPASGRPLLTPSEDMLLGLAYLTAELPPLAPGSSKPGPTPAPSPRPRTSSDQHPATDRGSGQLFASPGEVLQALDHGRLGIHARIKVRLPASQVVLRAVTDPTSGPTLQKVKRSSSSLIETTAGRVLFHDSLAESQAAGLPFHDIAVTRAVLDLVLIESSRRWGARPRWPWSNALGDWAFAWPPMQG